MNLGIDCPAMPGEPDGKKSMKHFFEKRDFGGHYLSLWFVVLMAFVTPICCWSVRNLRLDNEFQKWLPDQDPEVLALNWAREQFPMDEQILLSWDGSSINDPRIEKLVEQLVGKPDNHGTKRGGLPYVSSVIDPRQAVRTLLENGIAPRAAVTRLEGTLLGAGPLRLRLTETGRSALKKTRRELQVATKARFGVQLSIQDSTPDLMPLITIPLPQQMAESQSDAVLPAILSPAGELIDEETIDHDLQVTWEGMKFGQAKTREIAAWICAYCPKRGDGKPLVETCFFVIGSPVALTVGISEAGMADQAETVAAIRQASRLSGIPGDALHLVGSVVSASELNSEVLNSAWNNSFPLTQLHRRSVILAAALMSLLLTYALIRNLQLATLVMLISLFSPFCCMALIPATGGTMNMVLIVLPVLLVGLTLSGAIHVVNYWRHAASHDPTRAIAETVHTSWGPCFLASITTAIGLISLCTSSLAPVRQLGLYGALGAMLSFLMVVYGLPSLMQLWPVAPPATNELEHPGWRAFGKRLTQHAGWQSVLVIAMSLGLSLGLTQLRVENRLVGHFPEQSRISQDYWYTETNLAGAMPVNTIVRFDEQSQKETNFLDRLELIRKIQLQMSNHDEISGSVSLADFQPVSESPAEDAGFLQKSKYNKKATLIQQRIRDGEIENARTFYTVSERGHDLYVKGDQRLNQPADELWRITAQVNVMTDHHFSIVLADLHQITQDVLKLQPGAQHSITGPMPLSVRTQEAVWQSLISSMTLAGLLIFAVFMVMLRNLGGALMAMIPNVLPLMVVFGVYSWMHQRIEIGAMITASIALGTAVHGTLHFLTWVRIAMKKGASRPEAIIDALALCGPAIWQSSLIIVIGSLALVPAELGLISRFGWLMASVMVATLFGNLVLMPQLVSGPWGWVFEVKKTRLIEHANSQEMHPSQKMQAGSANDSDPVSEADEGKGPPAPHIKPIDPSRKKRRPTS